MSDVAMTARLTRELARLYPDDDSVRRVLAFAGIPTELVRFHSRALDTWFNAVTEADNRRRRGDLLKVVLLEHPDNAPLHDALRDSLDQPAADRPRWTPAPDGTGGVEKLMGAQSTLLPVAFLETGLRRARAVCRIQTARGASGTGFLIDGARVVTNHHVLPDADTAAGATATFNHQTDADGVLLPATTVPLLPGRAFAASRADDLTVVGTVGHANDDWGRIDVGASARPNVPRVNIIQHPGGGPKQIALYHNVVSHQDDRVLQYYTDTLPGSSGSPVFDDAWDLVAIHHAGGQLYNPGTKSWVYRNEGIAIARLNALLGGA
ncbi:trypsin-like peptidase domain-containing protein [Actinokineospora iranica]|uniref:Serine protease n=1 Tax=Actinokineospora iranica TaxID=1271860 RepID=A0A1G6Z2V1_9PSEU|nr:trypsin-like peptidase domain-containing protein [Actinokineospora iranica]SDD96938.1 V8-like Glu-specific endopeptidase [Actinokineospora iranica]